MLQRADRYLGPIDGPGRECREMSDVWMTFTLIAAFALIAGFVWWCGKTVDETGGEGS